MAKTETLEAEATEAKPVEIKTDIHKYEPRAKAGRYDQNVKDLIEAGEGAAITLTVPTDQVKKHMTYFQESAKQNNRTARKTDITDLDDGTSTIEFILRPLVKRPRKNVEPEATTDSVETAESDAPENAAA